MKICPYQWLPNLNQHKKSGSEKNAALYLTKPSSLSRHYSHSRLFAYVNRTGCFYRSKNSKIAYVPNRLKNWTFSGPIARMPEFTAPKLGKFDNNVKMEVTVPENASGVLYALGGFSDGLACYIKDGYLSYEYNLFEISRTRIKSSEKLPTGKITIEVESRLTSEKNGSPMDVVLKITGKEVAKGQVPMTAPWAFTANDCLDFGSDLGSPVSLDYYDQAPFKFNSTLGVSKIWYPEKK